jgi:hypothetical protein
MVPEYPGSTVSGTVSVKAALSTLCVIRLSANAGTSRLSAKRLPAGAYRLFASYGPSTDCARSVFSIRTLLITK